MSFSMITSNHDLCYMETDSFIIHIKTEDIYKDIAKEVKARFDNLNFKLDKPFPKRKNEKVNGLMKDELGRKALINFSSLIPKNFSYLTDDSNENKNVKNTEKCVIKQKNEFEDWEHCLDSNQLENKINQLQKIILMAIALVETMKIL